MGRTALLTVTVLTFLNYAALLPVVPMWASSGGAGGLAVGSTTAVMMGATVVAQCAAPLIFKLFRLREMMVLGALLLGVPAPFYILSAQMWAISALTIIRGLGFALVVIAGATLAADLARTGRLSSSASLYGTAAALPNLVALAGGPWAAQAFGFGLVFWLSGGACLVGAGLSLMLPARARGRFTLGSVRNVGRIATPIGLLLLTAAAFGATTTFLPISGPSTAEASVALLVASVMLIVGRLGAGVIGDRTRPGNLSLISALLVAGGLALTSEALRGTPSVLLVAAAMIGAGFGASQNDTFVLTLHRLGPSRSGTASTLWNMAYDGGLGAGALVLGWTLGNTGYVGAFLLMSIAIAAIATTTAGLHLRRRHRSATVLNPLN
ncbi:MFS transporter [Pseudactinotalea sp. Z1748]|uniref:MFS transporter n=1 Tax=Pseudactinotalea sp. Z1748 TaxID=3413027 RepID=UPI003C7BC7A7